MDLIKLYHRNFYCRYDVIIDPNDIESLLCETISLSTSLLKIKAVASVTLENWSVLYKAKIKRFDVVIDDLLCV